MNMTCFLLLDVFLFVMLLDCGRFPLANGLFHRNEYIIGHHKDAFYGNQLLVNVRVAGGLASGH